VVTVFKVVIRVKVVKVVKVVVKVAIVATVVRVVRVVRVTKVIIVVKVVKVVKVVTVGKSDHSCQSGQSGQSSRVGRLWFGPVPHVFVEPFLCVKDTRRQLFLSFCVSFDHFYIVSTCSRWWHLTPRCIEEELCLSKYHHPHP
jgi:hypothetical protein